jgi:hypothetical protein
MIPASIGVSDEDNNRMYGTIWSILGFLLVCVLLVYGLSKLTSYGDEEKYFRKRVSAVIVSKYKPADPDTFVLYIGGKRDVYSFSVSEQIFVRAQIGDSIIKFQKSAVHYLKSQPAIASSRTV